MNMSIPSRRRLSVRWPLLLVASALWLAAAPAVASAQADRAFVQYRQRIMQAIGADLNAISDIFRHNLPYNANIRVHAENLANEATLVRAAFEKQAFHPLSQAKPDLWANWSEFVKLAETLQSASAALASAAATGDMVQIGKQVKAVGATCKTCHDSYYVKESRRPRR